MVLLMGWNPIIQSGAGLGGDGSVGGWNPTIQSCAGLGRDGSVDGLEPNHSVLHLFRR